MDIEVRMGRVSCNKLHQVWPTALQFHTNGKELFAVDPPKEGHKRRDVPKNISSRLKCGRNEIRVTVRDERITDFALAVVLTKACTIQVLRGQVSHCDRGLAFDRVRRLIDHQERSGEVMCLTSNILSLKCPLTMERVFEPARGVQCQHLQCFGFEAFVKSNMSLNAFNNRWKCPICSLVVRPSDLCIDDYVDHVLATTPLEVDEVRVAADGSITTGGSHSRESDDVEAL